MGRDSREVLTRVAPPPAFTVRYGEGADHVADVWPGHAGQPLVLFIHGGFWRAVYDRGHTWSLCHALATEGYVVTSIEYARTAAGRSGWPATFDDVREAVRRVPP